MIKTYEHLLIETMSNPNSVKQKYLAECNLTPLIWVNNLICINHQLNGWAKENYHTLTIRNLYPNLIIQCWWFCATQIFPLLNDLRSFLMPKNSCNGRWKMMTNLDPNLTTIYLIWCWCRLSLRINIFKFFVRFFSHQTLKSHQYLNLSLLRWDGNFHHIQS